MRRPPESWNAISIDSACELKGSNLLGRTIPSDITEAAELRCDLRHDYPNDCHVLVAAVSCLARSLSRGTMRGTEDESKAAYHSNQSNRH